MKTNPKNKKHITYATWNCRQGVITQDNQPTEKLIEMEDYMKSNKIEVLVLIETDLHGKDSRTIRTNPISEQIIRQELHCGYTLWLPTQ